MKIRITSEGLGGLATGAELTLSNVPPPSWAGKYVIVDDDDAVPVVAAGVDTADHVIDVIGNDALDAGDNKLASGRRGRK